MSKMVIIEGNSNDKDNVRAYMVKGEKGATIASITKTATQGLVDTYTINIDDGTTQTFTVTNGKNIVSIEKTSTQGLVDTYTITFNDNTTITFTITNGFSPSASVSKVGNTATVTITDVEGTTTATINDGETYEVPTDGVIGWDSNDPIPNGYVDTGDTFGGSLPSGVVMEFAGATAPTGFLICDGSAISRSDYSTLFGIIGTTYGAGNGTTTFNIPNLKGKIPVGLDSTQTEFDTLGETGGEKTHTLTTNEMPSHTHQADYSQSGGVNVGVTAMGTKMGTSNLLKSTGGGQAHNNLQPYIVMNYIIKF